jgi:SAM-dependent methyltransferase
MISRILKNLRFPGSEEYWEDRYRLGGNSGRGSYGQLAVFKADIINSFLKEKKISSAIEFGCGDGNNLSLISYPKYIGLDVSQTAIKLCMNKFKYETTKSFYIYNSLAFLDNHKLFQADLSLSLDVIYHLIEDDIFIKYMTHLFQASQKYVIIYSTDYPAKQRYHDKRRNFTQWISENQKSFNLIRQIENQVEPLISEFFIYELTTA